MIHFVWIDNPMPDWAKRNIAEFERYGDVTVHDESVLLNKYKDVYALLQGTAQRSDLLRYSALQRYGGWYFDTDFFPLRPVADIIDEYDITEDTFFVARQQWNNPNLTISNGCLYLHRDKAQSVFEDIIDAYIFAIDPTRNRAVYGPMMFNKLHRSYPDLLTFGEADMFFPYNKKDAQEKYPSLLSGKCELDKKPFMVHLWKGF